MIFNFLLKIIGNILGAILSPIEPISLAVDFVTSISYVQQFIAIAAYLFPFDKILPLIVIAGLVIGFKIIISIFKTLWSLLPVL